MTIWNEQYYEAGRTHSAADPPAKSSQRAALQALVRRVIREELNEQDRLLVRLHWYRGKSMDEIARLIGADRSLVYRRMDRIHNIIYDKLKYAVDYRFDESFRPEAHSRLQNAGPNAFALEALGGIGERLSGARQKRRLSFSDIHRAAGIAPERMQVLELDGRQMMMTELSALCKTLGVGANELLFGVDPQEMAP